MAWIFPSCTLSSTFLTDWSGLNFPAACSRTAGNDTASSVSSRTANSKIPGFSIFERTTTYGLRPKKWRQTRLDSGSSLLCAYICGKVGLSTAFSCSAPPTCRSQKILLGKFGTPSFKLLVRTRYSKLFSSAVS